MNKLSKYMEAGNCIGGNVIAELIVYAVTFRNPASTLAINDRPGFLIHHLIFL